MIAGIFIELIIVRIDNISRFHGYSLTRFGFSVILVGALVTSIFYILDTLLNIYLMIKCEEKNIIANCGTKISTIELLFVQEMCFC